MYRIFANVRLPNENHVHHYKINTIHRWGNNSNNQRVLISTIFKSTNIDVPMVWSVINYR